MLRIISRRRIVAGFKLFLGLHPPGRNLVVRPEDTFLVSYPKSGNTWARFLIANLVHPEQSPDFANIDQLIPDPEGLPKRTFDLLPNPRIIRTHSPFDPQYRHVIYIVRDPRDIVVSQFHYHRKRKVIDDTYPIEAFVSRFIVGDTAPHGSWKENVASWLAARFGDAQFLLLRYEDMIQDTHHELEKIACFLGIEVSSEQIANAVLRSSAGQMRKLEQAKGDHCALIKGTRQDLPFVRVAKSGNWQGDLPEHCVATMEEVWGDWMSWLGYELVSTHPQDKGTVKANEGSVKHPMAKLPDSYSILRN